MKTILVPAGGGDTDEIVFETALAVALPFLAHLEFLHVVIDAGEAAVYAPHAGFARGAALVDLMARLQREGAARTLAARRRVDTFCAERRIGVGDKPGACAAVSAAWREEGGDAVRDLISRARHHDLIVVGRPDAPNGLPSELLELLLLGSGRPLLIAPSPERRQQPPSLPHPVGGTVLVCWKETADAARALTAAMPLLSMAERVVVATVDEDGDPAAATAAADDVARQLLWHGLAAEAVCLPSGRPAAELLAEAARTYGAGLAVMGGYGRSRARELIFGGLTQAVLYGDCGLSGLPVFIVH